MLDATTAGERLKEFTVEGAEKRRAERIQSLPEILRDAAFALIGRKPDGTAWGDEFRGEEASKRRSAAEEAAGKTLDAITTVERIALFSALYPKLGEILADWWMPSTSVPYQTGYYRKAFRISPNHRDIIRPNRLHEFVNTLLRYAMPYPEQNITFYASWAPYIGYSYTSGDPLGRLFAVAINRGGTEGEEVFQILRDSARGEHETGAMGRHVTRALLSANRPDGWEFCEKLLLAAQREEGLRQVILETSDEAHPEAFRRMLRLITEHDLTRFSATIRALDTWFGFGWDAPSVTQANKIIGAVSSFLGNSVDRNAAIANSTEGQEVYLALWTIAFDDASAAIAPASALLTDPLMERRFAATRLLAHLGLPESKRALFPALEDTALPVVVQAADGISLYGEEFSETDLFERLERAVNHFPKTPKVFEAVLWPWLTVTANQSDIADALKNKIGDRDLSRLLPYLSLMSSNGRTGVAQAYAAEQAPKTDETRDILFSFLSDASSYTRELAFKGLQKFPLNDETSAIRIEGLLTRKSADLRRSVLELLQKQEDNGVLESVTRLTASRQAAQRVAGLDLLGQMASKKRSSEKCRELAAQFVAERGDDIDALPEAEKTLIAPLLDTERETTTLQNALGLMDPNNRTKPVPPRTFGSELPAPVLVTASARDLFVALDAFVEANREKNIRIKNYSGDEEEMLLGDVNWRFPNPDYSLTLEEDAARLPLREEIEAWWSAKQPTTDPRDILRIIVSIRVKNDVGWYDRQQEIADWLKPILPLLYVGTESTLPENQQNITPRLAIWLQRLYLPIATETNDFLLDAGEYALSLIPEVPEENLSPDTPAQSSGRNYWRENKRLLTWVLAARERFNQNPDVFTVQQITRLWHLLRYLDEPFPGTWRMRAGMHEMLAAFRIGAANKDDVYDQLLGERPTNVGYYYQAKFADLKSLSGRKETFEEGPGLREIYENCRQRILDVELARGDTPTVVTDAARSLRYIGGAEVLVRVLKALGKESFVRGYASSGDNRVSVFSHFVRATFPGETETPEDFAARMKDAGIGEKQLTETALYAPQWARHVEAALGWPLFAEAVWWFHAHTKDSQWSVDAETRDAWAAEISDKTPLLSEDLLGGAVDVAWFHRVYSALGEDRWKKLDDAAKFTSSSGGHKRAQLFADAMLGRVPTDDLQKRITEKRNQDALRSLGLVPLPTEPATREAEALSRYGITQEFVRTSKQFGAQRQESEKLAARIGLQNLARTAGYPDANRLEWAMEAQAVADLKEGAKVSANYGDVTVTLQIDPFGEPDLVFLKKDKPLKNLPPAAKKDETIAALVERRRTIERQRSRMRESLESAMCRGDLFTGAELASLWEHPVLQPMLRSLVFVSEDTTVNGYLTNNATTLENYDAVTYPIASDNQLRIAHSYDLLKTGAWGKWQRDCFLRERIQPFKQVFRELYVLTDQEREDSTLSRRYAGHQVNPKQALALLGKRGWIAGYEEGVRRTFHEAGITATVDFMGYTGTATDVEGLTIEEIRFTRRGEWKPLPLTEIDPRLFSEAMRDLDLVVSVAHRGGVDPEASASTVEMRASLVREAAKLLRLDNVRFQKSHVLIDGKLATYSVHLGSAIVHRQPGGFVCIVPVHSQHRGRLFLPFADDDPRTAEVVSKVLLLAKDSEIKDPTILEQIRAKAQRET
jgi:hypothetical protein